MTRWNDFTKWWLLWLIIFVAIEGLAIATRGWNDGRTLSSFIWRLIDHHPIRRGLFAAAWVGLGAHFLWHWIDL